MKAFKNILARKRFQITTETTCDNPIAQDESQRSSSSITSFYLLFPIIESLRLSGKPFLIMPLSKNATLVNQNVSFWSGHL